MPKLEYNGARPLNVLGYEHQKPPEWVSIPTDADPDAQALVEPDTGRVLATIDTQINGLYAVEALDRELCAVMDSYTYLHVDGAKRAVARALGVKPYPPRKRRGSRHHLEV